MIAAAAVGVAGPAGSAAQLVWRGDVAAEARARLEQVAAGVLAALDRQLFEGRTARAPITVEAMARTASYRKRSAEVLGAEAISPYGVFDRTRRTVVVHATAGEPWLVHELVHARMLDELPGAAAWWDEGLASLMETASLEGGRLAGSADHRLTAVERAIGARTAPPLARLVAMDRAAFFSRAVLHVAMARLVCLWLQELGELAAFHRAYRAGFPGDPTGARALEAALARHGVRGAPAAEAAFRAFLGTLVPSVPVGR